MVICESSAAEKSLLSPFGWEAEMLLICIQIDEMAFY